MKCISLNWFILITGNWSSPPPTCNPIQCPSLFLEDPHLSLTELNTSAWGKAVFKCSWGYRLSGPPSLECEPSGLWSGPVPRCRGNQALFCFYFFFSFVRLWFTGQTTNSTKKQCKYMCSNIGNLRFWTNE